MSSAKCRPPCLDLNVITDELIVWPLIVDNTASTKQSTTAPCGILCDIIDNTGNSILGQVFRGPFETDTVIQWPLDDVRATRVRLIYLSSEHLRGLRFELYGRQNGTHHSGVTGTLWRLRVIVWSSACSGKHQTNYQSSSLLDLCEWKPLVAGSRGFPPRGPLMQKAFPRHAVLIFMLMNKYWIYSHRLTLISAWISNYSHYICGIKLITIHDFQCWSLWMNRSFLSDTLMGMSFRHARAVMHAGIANYLFSLKSVSGKSFPTFLVHAQPAILCIW